MRHPLEFAGEWTKLAPRVEEHRNGVELVWFVRGYPFTRPVVARSNVGVKDLGSHELEAGRVIARSYGPFVRVELMADGYHGQQASDYGWFKYLEWLGPIVVPNA